ncbi:MAG: polynucleotide adenylyltransferase [Proteobacteria bacterium]|nr:polynucleotide adenylyltransferase [Pseudomonadota bacterium]
MKVPGILGHIAIKIDKEGGIPILVGGAVRDFILGSESKDFDVEVFNIHYNQLIAVLKKFGKVSAVGKAFGVLKLSNAGHQFDFSLPRNDTKTGEGHRGFRITTNPNMSFRTAASRRDFTINSIGFNLISGEILDEFGGQSDLKDKILRVVDPATFVEDPLRVLRGIQFAARFNLEIPEATKSILIDLIDTLDQLPRERIFKEVRKLLLKAQKPSSGLLIADEIGLNKKLFPELNALHSIPHDPDWYPQNDAWSHTLSVIDEAARLRCGDKFKDMALMLSALCHEFTSLNPVEFVDEQWRKQYRTAQCPTVTKCFMNRITNESRLIEMVDRLVTEHRSLAKTLRSTNIKNGDIRRLSLKVDIPLLVKLAEADYYGRFKEEERPVSFPAGEWLLKRFHALKLESGQNLQPILLGRHLISLGLKPGPFFGQILTDAYEKQLDDEFMTLDDAISWAQNQIDRVSGAKPKRFGN